MVIGEPHQGLSKSVDSVPDVQHLGHTPVTIFDIRRDREEYSILEDIKQGLRPPDGSPKTLPTLLLYDVDGLKLFEKITYLEEYYLTGAEIEVLEKYSDSIAERIPAGSIVLELGSG
jgi:L-histidine Nalpha-methyltransferase / hercynylcysteine S-oxide synthase